MNQKLETTFNNVSLEEAWERLNKFQARKLDFIKPIHQMRMLEDGNIRVRQVPLPENLSHRALDKIGTLIMKPNAHAHRQIAGKLGIPWKYYKRMQDEHPELLRRNFNGWVNKEYFDKGSEKARKFLFRAYTNGVDEMPTLRALLSNSFLVIDNLNMLAIALKAAKAANDDLGLGLEVDKCDLSDTKFYCKFISPRIETEAKEALRNFIDPHDGSNGGVGKGNGIGIGFSMWNSEIGAGSAGIAPLLKVKACVNDMIWNQEAWTKIHLGARMEEGLIQYSNETKVANVELITQQMKDAITAFVSPDFLGKKVAEVNEMYARKLEHPTGCVQHICKALEFSDEDRAAIFDQFVRQSDSANVFSIAQAITSHAHTVDADKRFQFETAATGLMNLVDQCDKALVLN